MSSIYDTLNPSQQEAVFCTEGPLLVLAGAGSGKTRVLTHRIAYLIDEKRVNPWNIMAITFTNKAAGEMRDRVDSIVGMGSDSIWVSTFHSSCVRILRRHIEALGYTTNFTIYDSDDQKTLMKQVFKRLDIDPKTFKERSMLNYISNMKNELVTAQECELNAGGDFREKKQAQIYKEYQKQLKANNALDFDDLIMKTVQLFQNSDEILDYYQERFKYIMVDEYQDTNTAQFKLIYLLASKHRNLCVVGDDDQSIYKFRGANIENILNFEKAFPGARVIKLEQNYRSTQNILHAANEVIKHNRGRKDKTLWTANDEGELVRFRQFETANEEADAIIRDIKDGGYAYENCAVLYRTNAQSRLLEERCIAHNIPYRMVGGVNFYQRKEIKDILSYLKTIANGQDDLAVQRIVNVPKRGIGATSMGKVISYASAENYSLYQALCRAVAVPGLGKAAEKIKGFTEQIESFRDRMQDETYTIRNLIEDILEETGYKKELEAEGEIESQTRLENIEELINKAVSYTENSEHPDLSEFLEEVALVADVDSLDESESRVTLMTLHSAKGLEFPRVYLAGLEDGLFPSMMSIMSDDKADVEEERRLCYVGITRARENLMITAARQRMINGETRYSKVSRFVEEIPSYLLNQEKLPSRLSGKTESFSDSGLPWGSYKKPAGVSTFGKPSGSAFSAYSSSKAPQPSFGKAFTVQKSASLDYGAGDRVKHIKFGAGTVKSVKDGGKDYEVTVEFDGAGTKKMFASFAKLQKI
ncbi:DNA helicase PcrA [Clostridium sp. chh4-2]|uniref:DNA helicase PcrA n=1 Tax=Clostridium sp. chh4-2 TaxID=2067550 RepID=UPI000CCDE31F|nr:DNA helicase PcrA [Clostridium sp. chh4-2]PNV63108.1 DNA helicase PcrA [Clostridium sp. chh4-2]